MEQQHVIDEARRFAREQLGDDSSGHDWWHIDRVTRMAVLLASKEGADVFICELAALLHDVADEKLNPSLAAGMAKVSDWLAAQELEPAVVHQVMDIIGSISYKGGHNPPVVSIEAQIVQDADRLDAIGAIGIARTFAYSGWKGQLIHDPELSPRKEMTAEAYRSGKSTAIAHFDEKLLKLKNLMNTDTAKQIAEDRHRVMEQFLEQFHQEWHGLELDRDTSH
ncbi:HD domain-containing protein [Paenibacillus sp. WQ 127069]|uniref:HD domain-containing protein n=1 Tax=Paenibacillus baimaensis TaxID=2982185 RepID=A0ABT2UBA4_9BACL|nr:HD domain-containing protein [Paenibacillus sp. WQ 127069]MCU6791451.1 HD domain-containing protein [Paenibacillus sp. WQ 127069]